MSLLVHRLATASKHMEPLGQRTFARCMSCNKEAGGACKAPKAPPCAGNKEPGKKKEKSKSKFVSMWDPSCFAPPCPYPPPLDSIHYQPSDKATRKYTRTWNECPPRKVVKKTLCEFPKFKIPPMEKRPKAQRPETAKCMKDKSCGPAGANLKCIKISLPGCRKAREPPKCVPERGPADCQKIHCPYPAFSECIRKPYNPKKNTECGCLLVRSLCEIYNRMRQLNKM